MGQTTTITAGWKNLGQTPTIETSSTALALNCSSSSSARTIVTPPDPQETQVMTGCRGGIVAVTLRNPADNNKILASVTVTVYAKPRITSHSRKGYRYFEIDWTPGLGYDSYEVSWRNVRNNVGGSWSPPLSPTGLSGSRALIESPPNGAAIRGIEHAEGEDLEVKVIATTRGNLQVESEAYTVPRDPRPVAIGHVPDHVVMYDLSGMENWIQTGNDEEAAAARLIRDAVPGAASTWAGVISSLGSCKGRIATLHTDCPQNTDRSVVVVIFEDNCNGYSACFWPPRANIEGKLNAVAEIRMMPPGLGVLWTDEPSMDGKINPRGGRYSWVDNTLVHEFGHAFGLADRRTGTPHHDPMYIGIMNVVNPGDKNITTHDREALKDIYKTHTKGHGW